MPLSWIIPIENLDGSMPAHMKERDGNLLFDTQIQSLRVLGPLDGALNAPAAGHPLCRFIPRSGRL
jgi:hypothetical protein